MKKTVVIPILFAFTQIIIKYEGIDNFKMPYTKVIDSVGTVELNKRVKVLNDSTAVKVWGSKKIIFKK